MLMAVLCICSLIYHEDRENHRCVASEARIEGLEVSGQEGVYRMLCLPMRSVCCLC